MAHEEKDKACIDCSYWVHVKEMRVKCHVRGAGEAGKSCKIPETFTQLRAVDKGESESNGWQRD